jgi:hypothetical protein
MSINNKYVTFVGGPSNGIVELVNHGLMLCKWTDAGYERCYYIDENGDRRNARDCQGNLMLTHDSFWHRIPETSTIE